MVSESWLLNLIPRSLTVISERKCECGKHTIPIHNEYDLQIDVFTHCERWSKWNVRFRIYYRRANWCNYGDEYIGNSCGMGYRTIKEAIKALIPYIRKAKKNGKYV